VQQDGREPSIWDVFSHTPNKTAGGQTGDVADNSYNLYPADIDLMKAMDLPAFRFSISWSRIIHANGSVNQAGIDHYNAFIDALIAADIEPYATLYHWDLPTAYSSYVHGEGGDWLNSTYIVPLFVHYADVAFGAFGDRVKWWLTFNEPLTFCFLGYENGQSTVLNSHAVISPQSHSLPIVHRHSSTLFHCLCCSTRLQAFTLRVAARIAARAGRATASPSLTCACIPSTSHTPTHPTSTAPSTSHHKAAR